MLETDIIIFVTNITVALSPLIKLTFLVAPRDTPLLLFGTLALEINHN